MTAGATVTDRCTQYALDVVAGVIVAGEYVKLACQRHLDDLEKAKAAPYRFYFDVEKSEEIINFAEELTIAEGDEQENCDSVPVPVFHFGVIERVEDERKGSQTVQNVLCAVRQTERKIVHQRNFSVLLWQF